MSTTATLKPETATAAASTASPATPSLTHELFVHHMKAMAVHYKAGAVTGATHVYALPVSILHTVDFEGMLHVAPPPTGAGKQQVDKVLTDGQNKLKAFSQAQATYVNQQTQKLQGNHDTASFAAQMNGQREKAKQQADQQIDDTYNNLIKVGTAHPEMQRHILSATQKLGAFITSLLSSVAAFFANIVHKILGWINSAVDWVKGAAATVANWVAGAAKSIGDFFGSIF